MNPPSTEKPHVTIDDGQVGLDQLLGVAVDGWEVRLSSEGRWRDLVGRGRRRLEQTLEAGQPVYGVSTEVGYSSSKRVDQEEFESFAYTIIRQHGCGVGAPLSEVEGRAVLFARLVSLAKGYSAVRMSLLEALRDLLNRGVTPVIPRFGSVGASGDLTPLSYLMSVLIGEREAFYQGEILPADEALRRAGLEPHRIAPKESLAIMNGTAVMTGVGILALDRFRRALRTCERATALAVEVLYGRSQAFHPTAHALKPHPGQERSASVIRAGLRGSRMADAGPDSDRGIQDPYSIRCAPHVTGAARDALVWAEQVLQIELNSVNDNPLVDPDSGEIFFAGNFYGGHIALTMDLVKNAGATVADLIDRQFGLLVDSRLNQGLPESLVGYGGCGLKGLQITCSALTALAVQRSASDAVLSRPTEAYNQDKVSMGLNAAMNAGEVITLLQQITATLLIALSNAAHLRDEALFSPAGAELLTEVRSHSPVLVRDRRLDHDLNGLTASIDDPLGWYERRPTEDADG